jgi:hypothetical protein
MSGAAHGWPARSPRSTNRASISIPVIPGIAWSVRHVPIVTFLVHLPMLLANASSRVNWPENALNIALIRAAGMVAAFRRS